MLLLPIGAYYYEAVKMFFKLALWCALVGFEEGSEMQLGAAMIVNTVQLTVHIYLLPMRGTVASPAWLLNLIESGTLVLTLFMTFAAFSIKYSRSLLKISDLTSDHTGDATTRSTIATLSMTMQVLFFAQLSLMAVALTRSLWSKKDKFLARAKRCCCCCCNKSRHVGRADGPLYEDLLGDMTLSSRHLVVSHKKKFGENVI